MAAPVVSLHLRNGTLIDGTGAAPVPGTDVVVDGDSIKAVGPTGTVDEQVPAGAEVIDATGTTIMPGLIDAHCHVTFDDVQSNDELFFHRPPTTAAMVTLFNLPKLLLSGVTSMMDPDTIMGIGPEIRDVVNAGAFPGPRIKTGVQALLTSVGGTAGRLIPDEGTVGYAAVVNTRAPNAFASWIAVVPIPLDPPCTRNRSPAFNPPRMNTLE